jgi:chitinase
MFLLRLTNEVYGPQFDYRWCICAAMVRDLKSTIHLAQRRMLQIAITIMLIVWLQPAYPQQSYHRQSFTPSVIAYYTGHYKSIEKYDLTKLTHLVYGFATLSKQKLVLRSEGDSSTVKRLVKLKSRYPSLKIVIALGGWGGCKTCSEVFSSDTGRKVFSRSAMRLLDYFNLDGLDLDWEYPSIPGYPGHPWSPADKPNFTALLRELRTAFNRKKELSFAAGAYFQSLTESVDWAAAAGSVDRIHLMTYDLRSSRHDSTGHHTPLYSTPGQFESADFAVDYLLKAGVPASKIVIGAAFYGRLFTVNTKDTNALYKPGKFRNFILYTKLRPLLSGKNGYRLYYDTAAQAAYAFNRQLKIFVTFDNMTSVKAKATYVLQRKLGGLMFWELSQDLPNNGFLDVIASVLVVAPGNTKNK